MKNTNESSSQAGSTAGHTTSHASLLQWIAALVSNVSPQTIEKPNSTDALKTIPSDVAKCSGGPSASPPQTATPPTAETCSVLPEQRAPHPLRHLVSWQTMLWIVTLLLASGMTFLVGVRIAKPALPPASPEWGWLIFEKDRIRLLQDNRVVLDLNRSYGALHANGRSIPDGTSVEVIAIPLNGNVKP
jgi:hypothetical protein